MSQLLLSCLTVFLLVGCQAGQEQPTAREDEKAQAFLLQGTQALQQHDFQAALAFADSVEKRTPRSADAPFLCGRIFTELNRLDEAEAAYRRALELRPDYPGVWHNLGNLALHRQQFDVAVARYRRELAQHSSPVPWRGIGRAYVELGRTDSARYAFEQAIILDSTYVPAFIDLALLLERQGAFEQALQHVKAARRVSSEAMELKYLHGMLLVKTGRSEDAVDHLRLVVEQRPWHHAAHYQLGQALVRLGREEEARAMMERAEELRALQAQIEYLQHATRTQPVDPATYAALAAALTQAGRYTEALSAYKTALYLQPDNLSFQYRTATLHLLHRNYAAAIYGLERVLRQDSTWVDAWLDLGVAYAEADSEEQARHAWEAALRYQPGHPAARSYLAMLEETP